MALKLIYLTFAKLLGWIVLRIRSDTSKDIEILVLRHQLAVLQRREPRPRMSWADRRTHRCPRQAATRPPPTWADRHALHHPALAPADSRPPLDHPACSAGSSRHSRRSARAGPALGHRESDLGYRRVRGELAGLGYRIGASTVWTILHSAGIDPASRRAGPSWAEFLRAQARRDPGLRPAAYRHQRYAATVLCQYERHYNEHRPHRALGQAAPLRPLHRRTPTAVDNVRRRDRLGGLIHEYQHVA